MHFRCPHIWLFKTTILDFWLLVPNRMEKTFLCVCSFWNIRYNSSLLALVYYYETSNLFRVFSKTKTLLKLNVSNPKFTAVSSTHCHLWFCLLPDYQTQWTTPRGNGDEDPTSDRWHNAKGASSQIGLTIEVNGNSSNDRVKQRWWSKSFPTPFKSGLWPKKILKDELLLKRNSKYL